MKCTQQQLEKYLTGLICFKKENNDGINNSNQTEAGQTQSVGQKNKCIVHGNPNVYRITNHLKMMTEHWQHYDQWFTVIYRYLSRYADTFVALNGIEQIFEKKSGAKGNGKHKEPENTSVEEMADEYMPLHTGRKILAEKITYWPEKSQHQTCLKYLLQSIFHYVKIKLLLN